MLRWEGRHGIYLWSRFSQGRRSSGVNKNETGDRSKPVQRIVGTRTSVLS